MTGTIGQVKPDMVEPGQRWRLLIEARVPGVPPLGPRFYTVKAVDDDHDVVFFEEMLTPSRYDTAMASWMLSSPDWGLVA